jgi:biopolymer transport protein ExbB
MYPLLVCSLVALTFILERAIFWLRRGLARQRKRLASALESVRRGEFDAARGQAEGGTDNLLSIVHLGLSNGTASLRGTMEMAYAEEEKRINRFMMVLDTIVTLAPLMGILGTVLGIIESFDVLGSGEGNTDPLAVTAGIAKALITTAAGLVIAIATLIPYNYYRAKSDAALAEIEEVATFLEVSLAQSGGREDRFDHQKDPAAPGDAR